MSDKKDAATISKNPLMSRLNGYPHLEVCETPQLTPLRINFFLDASGFVDNILNTSVYGSL